MRYAVTITSRTARGRAVGPGRPEEGPVLPDGEAGDGEAEDGEADGGEAEGGEEEEEAAEGDGVDMGYSLSGVPA
ncbi:MULTISPECIES: hypothetical protein [unclassified Streptomyces]|uniref:hypothetical protein n=1 Tax=unclassified Streptomyces TaxID=2593676 RepID=UPI003816F231